MSGAGVLPSQNVLSSTPSPLGVSGSNCKVAIPHIFIPNLDNIPNMDNNPICKGLACQDNIVPQFVLLLTSLLPSPRRPVWHSAAMFHCESILDMFLSPLGFKHVSDGQEDFYTEPRL